MPSIPFITCIPILQAFVNDEYKNSKRVEVRDSTNSRHGVEPQKISVDVRYHFWDIFCSLSNFRRIEVV